MSTTAAHNALVTAKLGAESPEMKRARRTMGEVSRMETEYCQLKARLDGLAICLARKVDRLSVDLEQVARLAPQDAEANSWVGWWRKIGCPWYTVHGKP